ncbi:MAG: hypothetical protein ACR2G0_03425 [Chthoniobacterales bacterium]
MNDTIIFLALAGVALLFRLFSNMASSRQDSTGQTPPNEQRPSVRPPAQSEEERVRKFLEALGAPADSPPPLPVRPRTATRRASFPPAARPARAPGVRRNWAQLLPPVTTVPTEPIVVEAGPPATLVLPPPLPGAPENIPVSSLPTFGARKPPVPRATVTTPTRRMLRARGSLRQAIILREVLGPPRGLQAFPDSPIR